MKIVAIADTHGYKIDLPDGDVLVHAGDATMSGTLEETEEFIKWIDTIKSKFEYVLFTPGNHDYFYESAKYPSQYDDNKFLTIINEGIRIGGVNFWLSPYTVSFGAWAFMEQNGKLKDIWESIPKDTDVLVTHGPPRNMLDRTIGQINVGSNSLLSKIYEVRPKFHIFGHIHEAYGVHYNKRVKFINASIVNEFYQQRNSPVVFEV